MIALQIAVDVSMDSTIVHSRASGDPRASLFLKSQSRKDRASKIHVNHNATISNNLNLYR